MVLPVWLNVIFCLAHCVSYRPCCASTFHQTVELYRQLKSQTHKDVRPVDDQNKAVEVNISTYLRGIISLDERSQRLTASFAFGISWNRDTMRWNKSEHGGINDVLFSPYDIWIPELGILNSVQSNWEIPVQSSMKVSMQHSGETSWHTGTTLETTCPIDISKYPFDVQQCEITIGNLNGQSDDVVYIRSAEEGVSLITYEENDSWSVLTTGSSAQSLHGHTQLCLKLTLKRRPVYYLLSIIIPLYIISFMNILSFKIPAKSGERISYGVSLFLTFAVLLNTFSESIPRVSTSVSYLQIYINTQMVCSLLTTSISIGVVWLAHTENVDSNLRAVLWFCSRKQPNNTSRDNEVSSNTKDQAGCVYEANQNTRMKRDNGPYVSSMNVGDVVRYLDTVSFWVFLFVYFTFSSLCLLLMLT